MKTMSFSFHLKCPTGSVTLLMYHGSDTSSTPSFTFVVNCHVIQNRYFFDNNCCVFDWDRAATITLPVSHIPHHICIIVHCIFNALLLTLVTMRSGQNVHGFTTYIEMLLCGGRKSSKAFCIRMVQLPCFLNDSIRFRVPGHLICFLMRIVEFSASCWQVNRSLDACPNVSSITLVYGSMSSSNIFIWCML